MAVYSRQLATTSELSREERQNVSYIENKILADTRQSGIEIL